MIRKFSAAQNSHFLLLLQPALLQLFCSASWSHSAALQQRCSFRTGCTGILGKNSKLINLRFSRYCQFTSIGKNSARLNSLVGQISKPGAKLYTSKTFTRAFYKSVAKKTLHFFPYSICHRTELLQVCCRLSHRQIDWGLIKIAVYQYSTLHLPRSIKHKMRGRAEHSVFETHICYWNHIVAKAWRNNA